MSKKQLVLIQLDVAKLLRKVYMPTNMNRARTAHQSVKEAVRDLDRAIADAEANLARLAGGG